MEAPELKKAARIVNVLLAALVYHPAYAQEGSRSVYTQCGGELNGQVFPDNHTIQIIADGSRLEASDLGSIGGQCGNTWLAHDARTTPDYTPTAGRIDWLGDAQGTIYYPSREYPQCGGASGAMYYPDGNVLEIVEYIDPNSGQKTYSWRDRGPIPGQCGNPQDNPR